MAFPQRSPAPLPGQPQERPEGRPTPAGLPTPAAPSQHDACAADDMLCAEGLGAEEPAGQCAPGQPELRGRAGSAAALSAAAAGTATRFGSAPASFYATPSSHMARPVTGKALWMGRRLEQELTQERQGGGSGEGRGQEQGQGQEQEQARAVRPGAAAAAGSRPTAAWSADGGASGAITCGGGNACWPPLPVAGDATPLGAPPPATGTVTGPPPSHGWPPHGMPAVGGTGGGHSSQTGFDPPDAQATGAWRGPCSEQGATAVGQWRPSSTPGTAAVGALAPLLARAEGGPGHPASAPEPRRGALEGRVAELVLPESAVHTQLPNEVPPRPPPAGGAPLDVPPTCGAASLPLACAPAQPQHWPWMDPVDGQATPRSGCVPGGGLDAAGATPGLLGGPFHLADLGSPSNSLLAFLQSPRLSQLLSPGAAVCPNHPPWARPLSRPPNTSSTGFIRARTTGHAQAPTC